MATNVQPLTDELKAKIEASVSIPNKSESVTEEQVAESFSRLLDEDIDLIKKVLEKIHPNSGQ